MVAQRGVDGLHRIRPPAHLDDRRAVEVRGEPLGVDRRRRDHHLQIRPFRKDRLQPRRVAEVRAEAAGIDRRARDDELQVGPPGQQPAQVAEQEVDVQAALVRLVDDDRVVAAQQPVVLDLGQQQPVGQDAHPRVARRAVVEAHRVADLTPERHVHLERDPLGHGPRRDPPRLRMSDRGAAQLDAELRELRRLPRPRLARDDDDLRRPDRLEQILAPGADRQFRWICDAHGRSVARMSVDTSTPTAFAQRFAAVWNGREASAMRRAG